VSRFSFTAFRVSHVEAGLSDPSRIYKLNLSGAREQAAVGSGQLSNNNAKLLYEALTSLR